MPVQRNNLSWLYTTVGFCSLKFSLYLLLCPDSCSSQPDIASAAVLFVYLRKCSTAHPNAAILRIRVRIEPVRMCDYVRTERHAGRTSPAALPPTNHFRTNQYQNTHSTTPLMSLEPSGNQRDAGRHALPTAELSVTRRLADRSGISAISRMRRHTPCAETKRTDAQTHRNLQVMHAMTFADRQI